MKRHLVALVAGLAVGAGAARLAPSARVEPGAPQTVEVPVAEAGVELRLAPAPECAGEDERIARIGSLTAELDEAERVVAIGAAQTAAEIGAPVAWPADLPEAFTEGAIERAVTEMLDEAGAGRLLGLDCGEYPCVGVVLFPASEAGPQADRDAFRERFDASVYFENAHSTESWSSDDDGELNWLATHIAFPAAPLDAAAGKRVSFRLQDVLKTFPPQVEDAP